MCALSAQITLSKDRTIDCSPTTFAPVPFKTT